ncbi:uncharacterized protein BDFB_009018, partial [Asbolus verrucosus]
MAEGYYEYECMRAELLGVDKPDYDEFMRNRQEQIAAEEEEIETLKEEDHEGEEMKRVSSGLEELNSILQVTQRKINRFKASCGSLTNLLKIKMGHGSSSDSLEANASGVAETPPTPPTPATVTNGNCRKSDLGQALDNHVDRLDSMIELAEKAQYSMAHQNKEMKRFL